MKILHLISSNGIYGAESVLLNLLEKLGADGGYQAGLICIRSSNKSEPDIYFEAQKRGIEAQVCFCKSKLDREVLAKITDIVAHEKADIIHTHGYKSNYYGLLVAKKAKVPVVSTLHGWTGENFKVKLYDTFDRMNIRRMDFAICVSKKIKAQMYKFGMSKDKVGFIPNGVDTAKFDRKNTQGSLRLELGIENDLVIGTVGRLSPEKGHTFLIKAFKDIHDVYADTKLLIVGDGELKNELKKEAENLGLKSSVIFAGVKENMPEVYNSMDIFVLPSLTEGIPIALLEAMSMGVAVVATKVGGVPFVLEEEAGMMVASENSRELGEAVSFLIEKKALREEYGARACKRVAENFSVEGMVGGYKEVYKKVLRKT